ncbi:MAG: hypothetical protein AMXMBFR33_41870 [Candidatus Xenobia bacterium]
MKVYRYEETPTHWIEVVRPDELFDLSTLEEPPALEDEGHEFKLRAVHKLRGIPQTFAYAYRKDAWTLDRLKLMASKMPDIYHNDALDVGALLRQGA